MENHRTDGQPSEQDMAHSECIQSLHSITKVISHTLDYVVLVVLPHLEVHINLPRTDSITAKTDSTSNVE